MSNPRRHTITNVTISKIGLCAFCSVFLLAAANPAFGGQDLENNRAIARALDKVRTDSGLEATWNGKRDCLKFAAERIAPAATDRKPDRPAVGTQAEAVEATAEAAPRPSIKMFLRGKRTETPSFVSFGKIPSSSLSLHEFTYRPAKKTLVQRLGDTLEINVSVGTNHQLDPGHYEQQLPSVGLLLQRRFR